MSRTYRKPYTKSKRFDSTCRNHGSCGYCVNTRTYQDRKDRAAADRELHMYYHHYYPEYPGVVACYGCRTDCKSVAL